MADNFGLKIGVEGEKEFEKALDDSNSQFKVLGSEMKLATSQFDKNENSVESLTSKNKVLTKQLTHKKRKSKRSVRLWKTPSTPLRPPPRESVSV